MKVALCAIAKNENIYVREWVEYYKSIGISHIYIYDNNETDGERFEEVINDYISNGFVSIINVRGIEKGLSYDKDDVNLQPKCYAECYETYGKNYDYIAFFDVDEFLTFRNNVTLQGFLSDSTIQKHTTILIPWDTYGDNGQITYNNEPVLKRFTTPSEVYKKRIVKSIVKTGKEIYDRKINCFIHCFLTKDKSVCYSDGTEVRYITSNWYVMPEILFRKTNVILKHFKTKSFEEFFKRQVGRHWGTGHIHTDTPIDAKTCIYNYYTVNKKTPEREKAIRSYLKSIGETLEDSIVIANFTTWKKRDFAAKEMLTHFQKQTRMPDKIICWLSKEEYNGIIPSTIQECLDKKLLTEVRWVEGNTYPHKRWETFKENNMYTNIMIDDDILYPTNFVETLLKYSIQHPKNVITYYCANVNFIGKNQIANRRIQNTLSFKNRLLSGVSCFPPNTFPMESFKYSQLRDEICPKCDDSWINAWLIKKGIQVYGGAVWTGKLAYIKETQSNGLWVTENKNLTNGVQNKVINFAKALQGIGAVPQAKKVWPQFNIEGIISQQKEEQNIEVIKKAMPKERIIVTMTSWEKRLPNLPFVLGDMLKQTRKPEIINVNLSLEEFPEKEMGFPKEVSEFLAKNKSIQINWVESPNRKQWKKIIPTFMKYPKDLIVCIDDDRRYPEDFLEILYTAHLKYPNNPVSVNTTYKVKGCLQHCGHGTMEKAEFYGDMLKLLDEGIYEKQSSDTFFTYMANRAGHPIMPVNKMINSRIKLFNEIEPLRKTSGTYSKDAHITMWDYLSVKFPFDNMPVVVKKTVTPQAKVPKKTEPKKPAGNKKTYKSLSLKYFMDGD